MPHGARRTLLALLACLATTTVATSVGTSEASAHGFSSTVYVDVTTGQPGHVRTEVALEYDLLVVSAADAMGDDPLFQDGTAAFEDGDPAGQAAALESHAASVLAYVTEHLTVASAGQDCSPSQVEDVAITARDGVPYAVLLLDHACAQSDGAHEVTSTLFADSEGYVSGAKTIVTYEVDGQEGSAALDGEHPSFSTAQSWTQRFAEFFLLGAEHLLFGLDHVLFLLALIAGSRRLREIVLAATAFTVAHSLTFILAATGVVAVPTPVVEPVIALSIAVVAGWYLWRVWRRGEDATALDVPDGGGHLSLDGAGWLRLAVVFCFGLVHGLGFAGALGIDEPWSWTLLWSLLVFNVGIEVVQLTIIAIVFPVLTLLRRHSPQLGLWVTGAIASAVAAMGVLWFMERVVGA
ncbi:HupE/UreJ family protein [Cellulomonas sp.]|uniref:HupE/UreJ family protein n=1 Tax=Cellulomonas sp. TaxID=40001 RepID=UPI003BAB393A